MTAGFDHGGRLQAVFFGCGMDMLREENRQHEFSVSAAVKLRNCGRQRTAKSFLSLQSRRDRERHRGSGGAPSRRVQRASRMVGHPRTTSTRPSSDPLAASHELGHNTTRVGVSAAKLSSES